MSPKRRTVADEPFLAVRTSASDLRAGQVIGRHAHGWHQLIHASTGVLVVWTGQGSWVIPPSWGVWVPAGAEHSIRAAGEAAFRTLYVAPEANDKLPLDCAAVTISPLLRELILRATVLGMLDRREPVEAAIVMLALDEVRQSRVPPFRLPQPISAETRRAVALLAEGVIGLEALARGAGLSVRALERRFQAETGMSIGRWRRHQGLLAALEQLAGGASVKRATATAGYAAPSAFIAAFRALFGVTPARYFAQA